MSCSSVVPAAAVVDGLGRFRCCASQPWRYGCTPKRKTCGGLLSTFSFSQPSKRWPKVFRRDTHGDHRERSRVGRSQRLWSTLADAVCLVCGKRTQRLLSARSGSSQIVPKAVIEPAISTQSVPGPFSPLAPFPTIASSAPTR